MTINEDEYDDGSCMSTGDYNTALQYAVSCIMIQQARNMNTRAVARGIESHFLVSRHGGVQE
jgi:hypothetical protein